MRPEKQLLLDEIKGMVAEHDSFVLVRNGGLAANEATELRALIGDRGGDMEIVRKSLLHRAATELSLDFSPYDLQGHVGMIVLGDDPLPTMKVVEKFSSDIEGKLEFVCGRIDGEMYGAKEIERMTKLPSRDEMRAQILGLIDRIPSAFVGVLNSLLSSIPSCIDQKVKEKS